MKKFFICTALTVTILQHQNCGMTENFESYANTNSSSIEEELSVEEELIPFLSTWKVPVSDKTITLPLVSGHNYNFVVDWGDGETSRVTSHDDPNRQCMKASIA